MNAERARGHQRRRRRRLCHHSCRSLALAVPFARMVSE